MSKFKPLAYLVKLFVWIIRGTPLMLQIIIIFYGPGLLWDGTLLPPHHCHLRGFHHQLCLLLL